MSSDLFEVEVLCVGCEGLAALCVDKVAQSEHLIFLLSQQFPSVSNNSALWNILEAVQNILEADKTVWNVLEAVVVAE